MRKWKVTCLNIQCQHQALVPQDELGRFMLYPPACSECGKHIGWHIGGSIMVDTELEFHPIPFTEEAVAKEFSSCMDELHLWLESDEGKAACERAKYDPRGPWGQEGRAA